MRDTLAACVEVEMERKITVKSHPALRPAGSPAWVTIGVALEWSGDMLPSEQDPGGCGSQRFNCHLEALEL